MKFPESWNCPNFEIEEFVPPEIFRAYGEKSIWFLDKRTVQACQLIRERLGVPIQLNNWHSGGRLKSRGYRHPKTNVGAELSQHKTGRAADISAPGVSNSRLFAFVKELYPQLREIGVTTLEDTRYTPTWVHLDCRAFVPGVMPDDGFFIVSPS